ncbi:hypothetical protein [Actinoplanes sp. M2I2]|uniref:hypothetical protein n=1 Tax=Actinoplanes sp. M2I2 TaxID=1734444 RepID=UPI0020216B02|nr:hypothetical protein [Actinoplanes sp. M2I2]
MSTLGWLRSVMRLVEPRAVASSVRAATGPPAGVAGLDPITAPADPEVIAAAIIRARQSGADAESRLLWGRFAYRAAVRRWGLLHPVSVRAGSVYQRVLTEQALTFDAVRVCEQRLAADEESGDPRTALASRCRFAVALHRDGQCDLADEQIVGVLRRWHASPQGYGQAEMVLLAAAGVYAGCGRTGQAVQALTRDGAYLAQMDARCRRLAARWLASVVRTHPRWCTQPHNPGGQDRGGDSGNWLAVLDRCTATPRGAGQTAGVARRGGV